MNETNQELGLSPRNDEIIGCRMDGLSMAAIGAKFGISKQCVHQICKKESALLEYMRDMEIIEKFTNRG